MSYETARLAAEQLAAALDAMAGTVEEVNLPDEARKLRIRARQLREDTFKVVVVGEFKRGKSTLLNALLGADVLPNRIAPCTAVVTLIRYGDVPRVRVLFNDGSPEEILDPAAFRKNYELQVEDTQVSKTDFDRFARVDHAVVEYPVELCRNRVELVDSPGLGEHRTRTERTIGFLNQADAVVMVLDATQLLKLEETHFLETMLLPRGLKNIFFAVNKWDLIEESVLRPEDLDDNVKQLEARLRTHLTPFCTIGGRDCFPERVFRVNARGALKARFKSPLNQVALEESNIPAFEASLQRFLVEDRFAAKADVILTGMRATADEIQRYLNTQLALSDKSLAELENERVQLQPKLDRLRGIRKHIEGYLDAQSSILQDRLVQSFVDCLNRIDEELPDAVKRFDLSRTTGGVMLWKVVQDSFSTEKQFAKTIESELVPQVQRHLETALGKWHQSVARNELKSVSLDVEKYLLEEAEEYHRVLQEIDDRLGIRSDGMGIEQTVRHWLSDGRSDAVGVSAFKGLEMGVLADFSFLIGGIATDLVLEMALHLSTVWLPVIGVFITGARLWLREQSIRESLTDRIVEAIRDKLRELRDSRALAIRDDIRRKFHALREQISGNMGEEIDLIQAGLQAVLNRKGRQEQLRDSERRTLESARDKVRELFRTASAPPAAPAPTEPAAAATEAPE